MYKLFLTLRYLRKRRIAWFAVLACTLCVAMVLIVMSVMGGFLDTLKNRARGLLGDVIVDNRSYSGFPLYQEFIDEIKAWPEIVEATPVIYSFGLIRFRQTEQTATVRVVGLRLDEVYRVNNFRSGLYYERYYPGSTHLGEQQQPLLGLDFDHPVEVTLPDTGERRMIGQPALPPPLQAALQQVRDAAAAAGQPLDPDDDSDETDLNRELRRLGLPPVPGVYEQDTELSPTPAWVGEPMPGLIIGRDIVAERLKDGRYNRYENYPRGCMVTVTLMPVSTTGSVDTPIKQPFRYADDSRTGIYEIDSQHVYCDFKLLQDLLLLSPAERADGSGSAPGRCSQIQIKVTPDLSKERLSALTERLRGAYHALADDPRFKLSDVEKRLIDRIEAFTWEQSQAHVIAPVEKERLLVSILFGIISLVAVVLILCILYMIVLQKTRDIGIVKAIGGSSAGVACVFVFYGLVVGILGAALGLCAGALFVTYINDFQAFLIRIHPSLQVWDRSVYSFDEIPHRVDPWNMLGIGIVTLLASAFGSVAAAWRAGTMQPVAALRHE